MLTKDFAGKRFVRTSPITGATAEGTIKEIFYSSYLQKDKEDNALLKVVVHIRSTDNVVYDLEHCRIIPSPQLLSLLQERKNRTMLKKKQTL